MDRCYIIRVSRQILTHGQAINYCGVMTNSDPWTGEKLSDSQDEF
jgi:hypothetical protein